MSINNSETNDKTIESLNKNYMLDYFYDELNNLAQDPYYYKDFLFGKARYFMQPYLYTKFTASKITSNIYLSDLASACNKESLKECGITHIICTVLGIDPYYPNDFVYKNIPTRDVSDQNLFQYFDECVDFMDDAIKNCGKVLVHCAYGRSRSASIVIAYLIKKWGYTYQQAYDWVKDKREIIDPNPGFTEQLIKYEELVNKN